MVVLCETIVARSRRVNNTVAVVSDAPRPLIRRVVAFGADTATSNHGATVEVDDLAEWR